MNSLFLGLGCLWLRTLRIHWVNARQLPNRGVIVLWHEHLPACIRVFSHLGIAVLISKSADGAWAAEACRRFGYKVHRGSTTQGGPAGIRALARDLSAQTGLAGLAGMALDGPRGPNRKVQPGSLWLSQIEGIPIVPVFIRCKTAFRLGTWDKCLVPMPFSRIEVFLGVPFHPTQNAQIELAMVSLEHSVSAGDIYIANSQSA